MHSVTHSNLQPREQMAKKSSTKSSTQFAFSWADEVEREEQEQLQQQQQKKEQKTNPFGAARPREVVLAEKGVDWRARDRDRELDTPHHNTRTSAHRKRGSRAPPRRNHDILTPAGGKNISGNCNGWISKRKFLGEGSPSTRLVRSVAYQGRRVFGELNIEGSSSSWSSKNCNLIVTKKVESCEHNGSSVSMISSIKFGESGVAQKRRVKGKGRKWRAEKSKKKINSLAE